MDYESLESKKINCYPEGYLKLIIGCMFSGKTSSIIAECTRWKSIGMNVLVINYDLDKRYSDKDMAITHDKNGIDCTMLRELSNHNVNDYDVILVNEGQFFGDLKENVLQWCDEMKKIVIVSGLDGDYLRKPFGQILELIPYADDYIKLKAYCVMCKDGTEGIFTWKTIDRDPQAVVDIGTDKYIPVCRKHYNDNNKQKVIKVKGKKINNKSNIHN